MSKNRVPWFLLLVFLLAACLPSLSEEDVSPLREALNERYRSDDNIPTLSFGFDREGTIGQPLEVWFTVELSFTGTCTSLPSDPCTKLTDELAQIVFDNYRKIGDLAGIRFIMGSKPHYLSVESSDIIFQKSLTIEEWRRRLAAEK